MPKFPRRRVAGTALVLVGALAAATAFAHGAGPVEGAKYSGPVKGTQTPTTITFKVAGNGKKVRDVIPHPTFPLKCGAFGATKYVSKSARIKGGKFKAKVSFITDTGAQLPAGTVKGKFAEHKREAGTLTPIKAVGSACLDTFDYKTKAGK